MSKTLPDFCYSKQITTGETIIIKRGELGYYPTQTVHSVEELNEVLEVTDVEKRCMEIGSLYGWNVDGANPNNYNDSGIFSAELAKKNRKKVDGE